MLASNDIDPRRAGLLLYGLQIASHNLAKQPINPKDKTDPLPTVDEVIDDPELGLIAPETEWSPTQGRKSAAEIMLADWKEKCASRQKPVAEREKIPS